MDMPHRRLSFYYALLLVLIGGMFASCVGSATPVSANITVDLFSGRADNPAWSLSAAETSLLLAKLAALPPTQQLPPPSQLGYRGMQIELVDASGRASQRLHAYQGIVARETAQGTQYYADPQRTIERWLLSIGQSQLDPGLYQIIDAELR
jgi:hypothetical protein